jgi:hypothetical protein
MPSPRWRWGIGCALDPIDPAQVYWPFKKNLFDGLREHRHQVYAANGKPNKAMKRWLESDSEPFDKRQYNRPVCET